MSIKSFTKINADYSTLLCKTFGKKIIDKLGMQNLFRFTIIIGLFLLVILPNYAERSILCNTFHSNLGF